MDDKISKLFRQIAQNFVQLAELMDGQFSATRQEVLLAKYGLTCSMTAAAKETSKGRDAIRSMLADGRLECVNGKVCVLSLARYLDNPQNQDFRARVARQKAKAVRPMQPIRRLTEAKDA